MKWSTSALQALHRVPSQHREDAIRKIEKRAKSDKRRGVDLAAVYSGKLSQELLFPSTVTFVYAPHVGGCNEVKVHTLTKRVFMTGGSDGKVRVYHVLKREPVMEIEVGEGVTGVEWGGDEKPYMVLVAKDVGGVEVFDLKDEGGVSKCSCKGMWEGKESAGGMVGGVKVNGKVRGMIAGGERGGVVQIWKIEGGSGSGGDDGEEVEKWFLGRIEGD